MRALIFAALVLGCVEAPKPAPPPMPVLPRCGIETPQSGQLSLRLSAGPGVTEDEARAIGAELRDVWRSLGVDVLVGPPERTGVKHAVGSDLKSPHAPAAAVLGQSDLHLVVLEALIDPESPAKRELGALHGLTLGNTLFVSVRERRRPRPDVRRFTAAHELGHALGLEHHTNRKNLMFNGQFECVPNLTFQQALKVRKSAHLSH